MNTGHAASHWAPDRSDRAPFPKVHVAAADYDFAAGLDHILDTGDALSRQTTRTDSAVDGWTTLSSEEGSVRHIPSQQANLAALYMGPDEDRQLLQNQGCFSVPAPADIKAFMLAYFQFVHPNLPIVNEARFWALWSGDQFLITRFSLLVFQTMLFAASSFTPLDVLARCGLHDHRHARISLHRRAKLLFDFAAEEDPVHMSQAALLLTFHTPASNHWSNSQWLMQAILHARIARADKFHQETSDPQRATMLKRLWWGCLLRDRSLSLGLRRQLQITDNLAELGKNYTLGVNDFEDELGKSWVSDEQTQLQLFGILEHSTRLADVLTPTIQSLYTVNRMGSNVDCNKEPLVKKLDDVRSNLKSLYEWYDKAIRKFPPPVSLNDTADSVTVSANLLFISFDSAVIALCSYGMLLWETRDPSLVLAANQYPYQTPAREIMRAVDDISVRTRELIQTGTASYLPIAICAFLTLPLVLYALNVTAASKTTSESIERRQMDVFSTVMRLQQIPHEGSDFCWNLIRTVMTYAEDEKFASSTAAIEHLPREDRPSSWKYSAKASSVGTATGKMGWEDLLLRKPKLFLRLSLHVDVTLCVGRNPTESDFPAQLRRSETRQAG